MMGVNFGVLGMQCFGRCGFGVQDVVALGVGIAIIGVCEAPLAYWHPFREFPVGAIC